MVHHRFCSNLCSWTSTGYFFSLWQVGKKENGKFMLYTNVRCTLIYVLTAMRQNSNMLVQSVHAFRYRKITFFEFQASLFFPALSCTICAMKIANFVVFSQPRNAFCHSFSSQCKKARKCLFLFVCILVINGADEGR